jgi:hypothetical protein
MFEALQLVCSNGMMAYRAIEGTQKRHMIGLDLNKQLSLIQPGIRNYPKQIEYWQKLAVLYLTGPEFENFIPLLPFGQRHFDNLMHLDIIGSGGTLFQQYRNNKMNVWEIHNAVTQFITHNIESDEVRLEKSAKAEEAFMTLV